MNKKITVIELLNKIANGEEVPKKVKYGIRIYKFYKGENDYISYDDEETKWCGQTLLFNIMECHYITELLKTEVEILEDNTEDNTEEIEEIEIDEKGFIHTNIGAWKGRKLDLAFADKINELARAYNKIRKEKE